MSKCTLTTHPHAHAPDLSFGIILNGKLGCACEQGYLFSTLHSYRQIVSSTTEYEQASDKSQLSKVNTSYYTKFSRGGGGSRPYARYGTDQWSYEKCYMYISQIGLLHYTFCDNLGVEVMLSYMY